MPVSLRWRNTVKKEKENQGCKQERDKEKMIIPQIKETVQKLRQMSQNLRYYEGHQNDNNKKKQQLSFRPVCSMDDKQRGQQVKNLDI